MLANQIEIACEAAILLTEPSIDAAVFQRAEDPAGELRLRKQMQDAAIVNVS